MAENLWAEAGKPTSYNPLPPQPNNIRIPIGTDYVISFTAKSASGNGKVRVSSYNAINDMHEQLSLTTSFQDFSLNWNESDTGLIHLYDSLATGDIEIKNISIVRRKLVNQVMPAKNFLPPFEQWIVSSANAENVVRNGYELSFRSKTIYSNLYYDMSKWISRLEGKYLKISGQVTGTKPVLQMKIRRPDNTVIYINLINNAFQIPVGCKEIIVAAQSDFDGVDEVSFKNPQVEIVPSTTSVPTSFEPYALVTKNIISSPGKNMFDPYRMSVPDTGWAQNLSANSEEISFTSNTQYGGPQVRLEYLLPSYRGKTLTISVGNLQNANVNVIIKQGNTSLYNQNIATSNGFLTFTVPTNADAFYLNLARPTTINEKSIIARLQLEQGSKATPFEKYLEANKRVPIKPQKNYIPNDFIQGGTAFNKQVNNVTNRITMRQEEKLLTDVTYTISGTGVQVGLFLYNSDGSVVLDSGWKSLPYTFNSGNAATYKLNVALINGTAITPDFPHSLQMEEGIVPTAYESYKVGNKPKFKSDLYLGKNGGGYPVYYQFKEKGAIEFECTFYSKYSYNTVFDSLGDADMWECWMYNDASLAFRINKSEQIASITNMPINQRVKVRIEWDKETAKKRIYLNGVQRFEAPVNWIDHSGVFGLNGINNNNTKGDNSIHTFRVWGNDKLEVSLNFENGKKSIPPKKTFSLQDDFSGKISGSTIENPHIAKFTTQNTLVLPTSNIPEFPTTDAGNWRSYERSSKFDGVISGTTTNVSGQQAQHLFSFNIIGEFERKYGPIPVVETASKVQWLKDNIRQMTFNWYGYGISPNGNKSTIRVWDGTGSGAYLATAISHTYGYVQKSSITTVLTYIIDSSGFTHWLAYAEPSNGTTASTIYTDFTELLIETKEIGIPGKPNSLAKR